MNEQKPDISFSVTIQDIEKGRKLSCTACPTALSLKRKFSEMFETPVSVMTSVTQSIVDIFSNEEDKASWTPAISYRIPHPDQLKQWIDDFDRGYQVKPETFRCKVWRIG